MTNQKEILEDVPNALTTKEVCRRLKKSRRHIYRYIRRGWLTPVARFSGEFFFRPEHIQQLKLKSRKNRPSVPPSFAPLFPEYDLNSLHVKRDASLILSRILERGGRREIKWMNKHTSRAARRRFLRNEGGSRLSARALRFWSWYWRVLVKRATPAWRKQSLPYGVAA